VPGFLFEIALITLGIFLLSQVGNWFVEASPRVVSPVWPASGLAIAAVILYGFDRALPATFLGTLASSYLSGHPPQVFLVVPVASALEVIFGSLFVLRLMPVDPALPSLRSFARLILGACILGPAAAALVVSLSDVLAGGMSSFQPALKFLEVWQARAFGILVFGPFFLFAIRRQDFRPETTKQRLVLLGCSVALWAILAALITGGAAGPLAFILAGATLALSLIVSLAFGLRTSTLFQAMFVFLVPACVAMFPEKAREILLLQREQQQQFLINGLAFFSSLGCLLIAAFRDELSSLNVKMSLAIASADLCLWEWSPGTWLCRTASWTAKLGLQPRLRLTDEEWRSKIHEDDRAAFDSSFDELVAARAGRWAQTYRFRDAAGNWLWIHSNAQALRRTADDEITLIAGISRDVTEERNAISARISAVESEAELKTLRSQLNPHFLFNALNSVRALIGRHDANARAMITSLSSLLRSLLNNRDNRFHIIDTELGIVRNYLAIEAMRFGDRLRFDVSIDPELRGQLVPQMLILTLVENAVKHGISQLDKGGGINVNVTYGSTPGIMCIQVVNDGHLGKGSGGFGLENSRRRIALLTGSEGRLEVTEEAGPLVVATAYLPLDEERLSPTS
jgi:integral membrane sensor domain MASE1